MKFGYGTAGFRTLGASLGKVCFRVGILVAMRAKLTTLSGVMITASHNPKDDNGVKIVEGDGSMLAQEWEPLAEELVNADDLKQFLLDLDGTTRRASFGFLETIFHDSSMSNACFAMDSRQTSPELIEAAMLGCQTMGVQTTNFGKCTTP